MLKAIGTLISDWTDRAPGRGLVAAMLLSSLIWLAIGSAVRGMF